MFRTLQANEIDCRIGTIGEKGISLLLYKDARCDMNILDETVGTYYWQREHKELKGNIYCGVSIWNNTMGQWITKWDCGKESYTEVEKGESSDSFKRACVNWGIGRELYTAPFIYISSKLAPVEKNAKGKWELKNKLEKFSIEKIAYNEKKEIIGLSIINSAKKRVFIYSKGVKKNENNK